MDCYIQNINRILGKDIKTYELSFLSNYSISRYWEDMKAAKSFQTPYIYNSRLINIDDIQQLYSNLEYKKFDNFENFYNFIFMNHQKYDISVRLDMFYLNIKHKSHMGAHFITIDSVTENKIIFFDTFLKKTELNKNVFQQSVEDKKAKMSFDYIVVWTRKEEKQHLLINKILIEKNIRKRIDLLEKIQSDFEEAKAVNLIDNRIVSLCIKHSLVAMGIADFYHANGRLENVLFIRKYFSFIKSIPFLKVVLKYRRLNKKYVQKLKNKKIEMSDWHNFIEEYMIIIFYEITCYRNLIGQKL